MPQTYARTAVRRPRALTIAIATGLCSLFLCGGQHSSVVGLFGVSAAVSKEGHASAVAKTVVGADDRAFNSNIQYGKREKKNRHEQAGEKKMSHNAQAKKLGWQPLTEKKHGKKKNNKDPKKKDRRRHRSRKADKKQPPIDQMSHNAHVRKHKRQPLADKLFTCRMAPAVCSPGITERLLLSTIASAKMHEDIWFIGGWALSMVGFVIFGLGVLISKMMDGDDNVLNGASGAWTARKDEAFAEQNYQLANAQSMEDDRSNDNEEGDGDMKYLSKHGHGLSPGRKFGNGDFERREGDESGSHHCSKQFKSLIAIDMGSAASSEHVTEGDEMNVLLEMPSSQAKDRRAWHRFIDSSIYDDGLNATAIKAEIRHIPDNILTYWTDTSLVFVRPLLSFKCFVAFLLFIELNDIMAPEQSMLATPEVVSLIRAYPKKRKYVKPYVEWFMPGMINEDIDGGKSPLANGASYTVGAIIYVYLGVIGLMYNLAHSTQGCMLFILAAIPTIPFLETSRRANHWLRKFLYIGVLVPIYLFSGISKFRYLGIIPNLTGSWLWSHFDKSKLHRAVLKSLFSFIGDHHWIMAIFSWGNIILEVILPMILMLYNEIRLVQWAFHAIAIMFHATIFLLLGPNFARYCLLHLYAVDIPAYASCFATSDRQPIRIYRPNKMDWGRIGYAIVILFAWWYVQVNSDVMHLTGQENWKTRINPYWPFPELSMFAKPKDNVNFYISFIFSVLSFVILAIDMMRNPLERVGVNHKKSLRLSFRGVPHESTSFDKSIGRRNMHMLFLLVVLVLSSGLSLYSSVRVISRRNEY